MSAAARFVALALKHEVIRFGEFTLKSGRVSPYFFNLGAISTGAGLSELARCYVDAIEQSTLEFDLLFGPAYKGIPLATAIALEFAARGRDVPFAYSRKEVKAHGEGGHTAGAPVAGRVLIVDDVITAGTAVREAIGLVRAAGAKPVGLIVAFDRAERGPDGASALAAVERDDFIRARAVASLGDLIGALSADPKRLSAIRAYRERYGVDV
jgi:orotate phosphoribosyltransferase